MYKNCERRVWNEQNFKERLAWFNKVNAILETLPQFDCGSCGYANCRNLAIKIASGEADDSLCLVKRRWFDASKWNLEIRS